MKKLATIMIAASMCVLMAVPSFAAPKNNEKSAYRQVQTECNAQLKAGNEEIKAVKAEIKSLQEQFREFNKARKAGEVTISKEKLAEIKTLRNEIKALRGVNGKNKQGAAAGAGASVVTAAEAVAAEALAAADTDTVLEMAEEEVAEILEEEVNDEPGPNAAGKTSEVKELRTKAKDAASNGNYDEAKAFYQQAIGVRQNKLENYKAMRDKWKQIIALTK